MNIQYKDVSYPIKHIKIFIDNEPTDVIISVQSLSDAMGALKENPNSTEEEIDNGIYFYVSDDQISLPDTELAKVLDEEFDIVPSPKTKVILEFYMEMWFCYEDGKSMNSSFFTRTTYDEICYVCDELDLDVVQTIDLSYLFEN